MEETERRGQKEGDMRGAGMHKERGKVAKRRLYRRRGEDAIKYRRENRSGGGGVRGKRIIRV